MTYDVVVLRLAEFELNRNALWWAENRDVDQALRWLNGFTAALAGLAENPERHGLAREDELFDFPLRQLLFGVGTKPTHRALFRVRDNKVLVHLIRHLAQDDLTPGDIKEVPSF